MSEIRKPPVGAKPGTLAIDRYATRPRVRAIRYSQDHFEEREIEGLEEFDGLLEDGRKLWIDVEGLGDEALLRRLAEIFAIHPLALEDVVNTPVRPKAEVYEENLLIVSRAVDWRGEGEPQPRQISLILGKHHVLSFRESPGPILEPVVSRLRLAGSRMRLMSVDYLAYAMLDTIVDTYYPIVEEMGERLEQLEDWVLDEASPDTPRELNRLKGELLILRRAIAPQRESVQALMRDDHEWVTDAVRVYLRDTYDHVVQIAEAVEQGREFTSSLLNTYLTVVSNRMNEVMKTLTIVASIFIPLTFLAGIYGMNFEYMPELAVRWAYPGLLGVMAVVTGGMVFYFWRKGWLGRRK
jgi:magnesium transporter